MKSIVIGTHRLSLFWNWCCIGIGIGIGIGIERGVRLISHWCISVRNMESHCLGGVVLSIEMSPPIPACSFGFDFQDGVNQHDQHRSSWNSVDTSGTLPRRSNESRAISQSQHLRYTKIRLHGCVRVWLADHEQSLFSFSLAAHDGLFRPRWLFRPSFSRCFLLTFSTSANRSHNKFENM